MAEARQSAHRATGDLAARLQRTLPDARIEVQALPGCPAIRLGLINADFPLGPLPAEVMHAVIAQPAYWAFCWGSGLALARLLLQTPDWVRGRRVVDLGPGSGVVAIAAALAGAARVIACDNDPDALAATAANAVLNGVTVDLVDDLAKLPPGQDVLLMADVLYDRSNLPLLDRARALAAQTLVADSRIATLPDVAFRQIATLEARTFPNLGEFDEFRTVRVFHAGANDPPDQSANAAITSRSPM
ncbi:MAG: 50S ribosomal protein L11 methyltransferase [Pseudomonadales bacterium]|nr:50S ribosomal protein L11 methyltransferase [Pseudomonadales bacterium]